MPSTDPNLNLQYGWTLGESGWHEGMDANLKKLGAVVHLSVKSRAVYTPPTSPANGDRYIIPAGATGDWAGRDGQIAVRVGGVWEYYTAAVGWVAYVEDENKQVIYTPQGWALVDDVLGLGTMAGQDANNVNITGGQINANIVGGTFYGITPTQAGLALLDDTDAAAQRETLGLGAAATKDVGTSGDAVPLLSGNNTFSGTTTFNNKVGIGTAPSPVVNRLHIFDKITDSTKTSILVRSEIEDPSGSSEHIGININTALNSSFNSSGYTTGLISSIFSYTPNTISGVRGFYASLQTLGGGNVTNRIGYYDNGLQLTNGTVSNNYAFFVGAGNVGAVNNYGFYSAIPAGAGRWNFFANGTAENFFRGRTTFNTGFARTPTVSTAPDGSTITLTSATNHLLYNNASVVASLTINLPTNDVANGQEITIATRSAITALTVGAGSTPVYGAPTTLPAGGFATFIYSSAAGAWFRKG